MSDERVLRRFRDRALDPAFRDDPADPLDRWAEETGLLQRQGIAVELALQYLHTTRPDPEAFATWLAEHRREELPPSTAPQPDALTEQDLASWDEHGFVVLKNAVPSTQCAAAREAIWAYLGASPDDPGSWYAPHPGKRGLMLSFFHHPALQLNRQSARIRRAYAQLYRHDAIYGSVDKVSFNPPIHANYRFLGSGLHWDESLVLPMGLRLQGLLYLTDCEANDGAFHCVPGFHRGLGTWLESVPAGADPRALAPTVLTAVPVPARAGDFVIWHAALPHCASPNRGTSPRLVQYLTYLPTAVPERKVWR